MDNEKIIQCKLINREVENKINEVILKFDDEYGYISFNNDDQTEIKKLFNNILKDLIDYDLKIELVDSSDEIKPAYLKDVAEEYINQLNDEISKVKDHLETRFRSDDE